MLKMVERPQQRRSDHLIVEKGVDDETQAFYDNKKLILDTICNAPDTIAE